MNDNQQLEHGKAVAEIVARLYDAIDPSIRAAGYIALPYDQWRASYDAATIVLATLIVAGNMKAGDVGDALGRAVGICEEAKSQFVAGHG